MVIIRRAQSCSRLIGHYLKRDNQQGFSEKRSSTTKLARAAREWGSHISNRSAFRRIDLNLL